MIKHHKTTIRTISMVLTFLLLFNALGTSFAEAISVPQQQISTKKLINADIGEIPDKLPKQKLELKSKRTEYSTRYLNPDGSFTEEIFLDAKYYKDSSDKQWKEIDNNLVTSTKKLIRLKINLIILKCCFLSKQEKKKLHLLKKIIWVSDLYR